MTEDLAETELQDMPLEEAESETVDDEYQTPVYNKIQVQDVVKREKQKAYEKGRRAAMMELQQEQQPQSLGGMSAPSREEIQRLIAEQAPQLLQDHVNEMQAKHTVNSFVSKMQSAEQKYPGIQEKLNELDYNTITPLIKMANDMENTGDIVNELITNPMKMGNLLALLYAQPKMAQRAMNDLSQSIKVNEDAKTQAAAAKDPMSQLKPSQNAGMDNGNMSVSDFRKMFR
jgi:hypothetical protein